MTCSVSMLLYIECASVVKSLAWRGRIGVGDAKSLVVLVGGTPTDLLFSHVCPSAATESVPALNCCDIRAERDPLMVK